MFVTKYVASRFLAPTTPDLLSPGSRSLYVSTPHALFEGLGEQELVSYSTLNEEAEAVPIGCEGLVRTSETNNGTILAEDIKKPCIFPLRLRSTTKWPPPVTSCFHASDTRRSRRLPLYVILLSHGPNPDFGQQVCLDHFQGNRTPFTDPLSRGALAGLTLKHGGLVSLETVESHSQAFTLVACHFQSRPCAVLSFGTSRCYVRSIAEAVTPPSPPDRVYRFIAAQGC